VPFCLLFGLYGVDFEGYVPSWWCFLQGICYFFARLLDEMDGKQARKTGNSSPVGLLFDHGCDSFTTAILTMMMAKMMQLGNGPIIMLILMGTTQSFHFCTLEEYYIGGLFLGPFNGVTDASAMIISFFIFTGIFGTGFWAYLVTLPFYGQQMKVCEIIAWTIIITQIIAVALK
jgi:ethanolaminephosphotransferase